MATVFLSFIVLALVMAGMAVGVILRGKPIKGTCGGIGALGMGAACDICGGDTNKCEKEKAKDVTKNNSSLAYDATKR